MSKIGLVLVPLCAALGCSASNGGDAGWVPASDALAAHGVAQYRASATATGQKVLLRDGSAQTIGELELAQADGATTVSLEFRSDAWKQIVVAADGTMTLSLDGRQATLRWEAGAWIGDAAAQALLADSQPYAEFVKLVGVEAGLGGGVAMGSAASAPSDTPKPAGDMSRTPPTLCCGDVVTTGSGWAWYWEPKPEMMACKRAIDTLQAGCNVSSGYDCCNVPAAGCTACVDWGTGYACSTVGYLQYAAAPGDSCK